MHNRQIMVLSKAECRGIFREHARPRSIPNGAKNPIWTVLGPCQMGFIASFGKAPGSGSRSGAPAAGAGGFRSRRGRRGTPTESPPSGVRAPHRARVRCSGARERKGALLSEGPLGDLEAKPGFEPGVKALQASALPLGHFAVDMKRADSKTGPMHAMERTTGLEPATPTLARLCSTN